MCDSSTLGALQIPKVSIVLHFQHLNLTGDVVGGPGVGLDPAVNSFSRPWFLVGVPGIRCPEQKVSRVLDFEHSMFAMCR